MLSRVLSRLATGPAASRFHTGPADIFLTVTVTLILAQFAAHVAVAVITDGWPLGGAL